MTKLQIWTYVVCPSRYSRSKKFWDGKNLPGIGISPAVASHMEHLQTKQSVFLQLTTCRFHWRHHCRYEQMVHRDKRWGQLWQKKLIEKLQSASCLCQSKKMIKRSDTRSSYFRQMANHFKSLNYFKFLALSHWSWISSWRSRFLVEIPSERAIYPRYPWQSAFFSYDNPSVWINMK